MADADSGPAIPFRLESRPYLPVFINGAGPYWFIFDTGAQGSDISPRILEALSLEAVGGGVSLKEFRIGGLVWTDLKLGVGDTTRIERVLKRPIDGLIGDCFMAWATLVITIDYPRSLFSLKRSNGPTIKEGLPIQLKNYLPVVPVHVNGTGPYAFLLDTGASFCTICPELAGKLGLPQGEAKPSRGVLGDAPANMSTVRSFAVAEAQVDDLQVMISDCSHACRYTDMPIFGGIGHSFLKHFAMTLDYPHQSLRLHRSLSKC